MTQTTIDKSYTPIVSISDIHLGNKRVTTSHICVCLNEYFFPELLKAKVLFLIGDLLDTAIEFSERQTGFAIEMIIQLLVACSEHDITIILVRGTISHDRTQLERVVELHKSLKCKNDLRYYDKVSVDYIEKYDLKLMIFPDDLPYESSNDAVAYGKSLMRDKGWKSVDYALIHGSFDTKIPANVHPPKCTYRENQFKFVGKKIVCGHEHEPSDIGMVAYNGSFDRLAHGQQGPKGFLTIRDFKTHCTLKFVENKGAMPFHTWDLSTLDAEHAISKCVEMLDTLSHLRTVYVRVIHPSVEVRTALSRMVATQYPNVKFTHMKKDKAEDSYTPIIETESEFIALDAPTLEKLPSAISTYLAQLKTTDDLVLTETEIATLLEI